MFAGFCKSIMEWGGPIATTAAGFLAGVVVEGYTVAVHNCDENTRLTTLALLTIGAAGSVFASIKGRARIKFYDEMSEENYRLTSTTTCMYGIEPVVRLLSTYVFGVSLGDGVIAIFVDHLKKCPSSFSVYPYTFIGLSGGFILLNVALNEKVRRLKNRCAQIVPVSSVYPSQAVDYTQRDMVVATSDIELQVRDKEEK